MNTNIFPCFWFDGNAPQAAEHYCNIFPNAKISHQSAMVIMLDFNGQPIMLLNGGSTFKPNPSISIMVMCETAEEVEKYYNELAPKGKILMDLGSYPWSEKYAWISDEYNISWQFYLLNEKPEQKYVPTLMYIQENNGKCREAMNLYTSVFPNSKINGIKEHPEAAGELKGMVAHADFSINDYLLYAMDGGTNHQFNFTEGVSLVVMTDDQQETDMYWNALTANGGQESMCGWLKDPYGVSWQITPKRLIELTNDENPDKAKKVFNAMLKMKKIIIADLETAYNS